ncbi:MAG: DsrE family protein [Thermonemataceae bacterium]|nr:DsrE family protein [Thermonemataceae bacterium]
MKKIVFLSFLLLSLSAGVFAQKKAKKSKMPHKVVMQLTTGDTLAYKALMNQLGNMTKIWEGQVDIVVVIHNKGVKMMQKTESKVADKVKELSKKGVRFEVCDFTLQQMKISRDEILEDAVYTPYGLIEIVTRQEDGYKYLKAGF